EYSDGTNTYNGLTRTVKTSPDGSQTLYAWDHRERLTEATFKSSAGATTGRVTYRYDPFDRLIGRQVFSGTSTTPSQSQSLIYDPASDQIVLPRDSSGAVQDRYLWGPAVDQLLAQEDSSGNVLWALGDHENTIRDWASYDSGMGTTSVVDHAQYDAFGNRLN